jgi:diguanylate cyclase (GGDEF)-like protein
MESKTRVLVAHLDDAEIQTLNRVLSGENAETVVVRSGPEALEAARGGRFQLAVLSTVLPGVHGFEVCRRLSRELMPSSQPVPVVLVTDVDDPYVRARARHAGARALLLEPLEESEIRRILSLTYASVDPLDMPENTNRSERQQNLLKELLQDDGASAGGELMAQLSDPLTGLLTEDYMVLKTQEECKRASRYEEPLSLLVAEIDNYDQIVASHGAQAGDEALLEVAGVFLCESRDVDVAGRVRHAQFQLLMPCTPREGARIAAARVYESLTERRLLLGEDEVQLSISLGLATHPAGGEISPADLVRQAETNLAVARRQGRVPVTPREETRESPEV